jgi:nucleotide-binding universal stress UspA family protein
MRRRRGMTQDDTLMKRIIVPLDGSDSSFRAAEYAIKLAKMANAELLFMHIVVNPPYVEYRSAGIVIAGYIEEAKRHAETSYMKVGDLASKNGVKFSAETILDVVSAAYSIVNYAKSNKADPIVIGIKGRTGLKWFLLGSVASGIVTHVVTHASCP